MFAQPHRPPLRLLVRSLDREPERFKRLIRNLADEDRADFVRSSARLLASDVESPEARTLIGIIVEAGLLFCALSSPLVTNEKALAIAQAAMAVDPSVDVALARTLAEDASPDTGHFTRLLEILAVISDSVRIFPSLVRLLRHPSPHIRSKAVLLMGRGNRSPKWLRERLDDTDPRIRANAAEALWGVDSREARDLLETLVHDGNNRVAGNAILGLYRLGDCSMIPEMLALARHETPLFRATAAWLMGETGDPRFTETVAGLLREGNTVVRKRAFAALGAIRAAVAQAVAGPKWRLSARLLDPDPANRKLFLGIENGPALLPTQIFVAEDGVPVHRYQVLDAYEIRYRSPNPEARSAKIRVHGPGMSAETSVSLTATPEPAEA